MIISHCNTAARLLSINAESHASSALHAFRSFLEVSEGDKLVFYHEHQKTTGNP